MNTFITCLKYDTLVALNTMVQTFNNGLDKLNKKVIPYLHALRNPVSECDKNYTKLTKLIEKTSTKKFSVNGPNVSIKHRRFELASAGKTYSTPEDTLSMSMSERHRAIGLLTDVKDLNTTLSEYIESLPTSHMGVVCDKSYPGEFNNVAHLPSAHLNEKTQFLASILAQGIYGFRDVDFKDVVKEKRFLNMNSVTKILNVDNRVYVTQSYNNVEPEQLYEPRSTRYIVYQQKSTGDYEPILDMDSSYIPFEKFVMDGESQRLDNLLRNHIYLHDAEPKIRICSPVIGECYYFRKDMRVANDSDSLYGLGCGADEYGCGS